MNTTAIGNRGEELVSQWLFRHGYEVIDRNYKTRWCEIDIVARKSDTVYFIEVKYRKTNDYGDGLEYITTKKLEQMHFAAEVWMKHRGYSGDAQLAAAAVDGQTSDVIFLADL